MRLSRPCERWQRDGGADKGLDMSHRRELALMIVVVVLALGAFAYVSRADDRTPGSQRWFTTAPNLVRAVPDVT
jgi:hypothetical protein